MRVRKRRSRAPGGASLGDDLRSLHAGWITRRRKPIEERSFLRKLVRAILASPWP